MTDYLNHEIFFQIHSGLPREAPGSEASTLRAFSMLPGLPAYPHILDIGCGPGAQTVTLARASQAEIKAIDTHQPFLEDLTNRAAKAGVAERIHPINTSMFDLKFDEPFDLIWSEGAVYIMGFERGLSEWRRLLKPGGFIVVSELSWLKPNPPETVRRFWETAYPGMATVDDNLAHLTSAGYRSIGHFTLPESDWWDNYYHPMAARINALRDQHHENTEAQQLLDIEQAEIDLYRQFSDWYGYVFYIGQAETFS